MACICVRVGTAPRDILGCPTGNLKRKHLSPLPGALAGPSGRDGPLFSNGLGAGESPAG